MADNIIRFPQKVHYNDLFNQASKQCREDLCLRIDETFAVAKGIRSEALKPSLRLAAIGISCLIISLVLAALNTHFMQPTHSVSYVTITSLFSILGCCGVAISCWLMPRSVKGLSNQHVWNTHFNSCCDEVL